MSNAVKITEKEIESITTELYKKNFDLFNANRSLKLLQKLYKIIVNTFKVEDVAQEFINTIVHDLDFASGIVVLKGKNNLEVVAATNSKINQALEKIIGKELTKVKFSLRDKNNTLVKTYKTSRGRRVNNLLNVLTPLVHQDELEKYKATSGAYTHLVYPIELGSQTLGCLAISSDRVSHQLSDFEKTILRRIGTVFGIAIDRAQMYQDLRKANKELRKLDKLKDEFVYIATHELKTPVTVMKGYLNMIDGGTFGKVPKEMDDPLKEITAANRQLVVLVNDLLQIARSEANSLSVNTAPVNLCEIVDNTVKNVQALADQKKLKVKYSCGKEKMVVMADEDRLKEIINNLLSNAIKYSDNGTISVDHVVQDKFVITHVADQGHGMSKEDQKKVFSRFFRAEILANKVPGTGLGLFIVKQLVEKMGGKIWFTSELEKGTTFSFSLPRTKAGAKEEEE